MILKVNEDLEMSKSENPNKKSDSNNNLIEKSELIVVQDGLSGENVSKQLKQDSTNKLSNTEGSQPISELLNETIKNALAADSETTPNLFDSTTTSLFSNNSKQTNDDTVNAHILDKEKKY